MLLMSRFFPCGQKRYLVWLWFLKMCGLVLWSNTWSVLENESIPFAVEKKVYSVAVGWYTLEMSVRFICTRVWFNSTVFLFTFCLDHVSIAGFGLLKFTTSIVLQSLSPLRSINICFIYLFFNIRKHFYIGWIQKCYILLLYLPLYNYIMAFIVSFHSFCLRSLFF